MKSLIAESDRSGNPITIKALSREPDNTDWTVYTLVSIEPYMDNQFQSNQPHNVADDKWHKLVLKTEQIMTMMT